VLVAGAVSRARHIEDRNDPVLGAWLKRAAYASEREVRVGLYTPWFSKLQIEDETNCRTYGLPIDWPVEQVIEQIVVYPEADFGYIETVTDIVSRLAPTFGQYVVCYSSLASSAPY
jgi:hypothetical protein